MLHPEPGFSRRVRSVSSTCALRVDIQLFQQRSLTRQSSLHCAAFAPWSQVRRAHSWGLLLGALLCSIDLPVCSFISQQCFSIIVPNVPPLPCSFFSVWCFQTSLVHLWGLAPNSCTRHSTLSGLFSLLFGFEGFYSHILQLRDSKLGQVQMTSRPIKGVPYFHHRICDL